MEEQKIQNTPLQEEWTANNKADTDERAFCKAAARLGFYPYNVPEDVETAILDIAEHIPPDLYSTFFGVADPERLPKQAERLTEAFNLFQQPNLRTDHLPDLREEIGTYDSQYAPWQEGYDYARRLRGTLGREESIFETTVDVAQVFSLNGNGTDDRIQEFDSEDLFDALVVSGKQRAPGFALDKHRDDAKKFALCRGLFEYLNASNGQPLLVTRENTERQKRNRAFAAGFLAPSSLLSEAVPERIVDEEELDDLADTFGVSSLVIQHQLENHQIVDEVVA